MKQEQIRMAHGSGGKLSQELVEQVILPAFGNAALNELHDGARLMVGGAQLAFSTDSYVVKPRFFAGGDIGKLAVCGTVNDLAMTGAAPRYLSVGFILEEGLPIDDLTRIVASMEAAAREAGVLIVTGDTKVVEKGAVDGVYINTAGIGDIIEGVQISPRRVRPGQDILLSGCIGDHATAILAGRHDLILPRTVVSDCAPLNRMVKEMLAAAPRIAALRDPTRGGVAAVLNEIAGQAGVGMLVEEAAVPVRPEVAAVCDILGFDPLYLANEGKLLAFVEPQDTERVLAAMRAHRYGREARLIGKVTEGPSQVGLRTAIGGVRLLDMPLGDQIPRIC